jgi:hypothetical protein
VRSGRHRRRRARGRIALDAVAVALALLGVAALAIGATAGAGLPRARAAGSLRADARARASHRPLQAAPPLAGDLAAASREPEIVAEPVAVSIPAIGVDASLVRLGLNADGTLEVPADVAVAGWYGLGPRPGAPGAAVLAGHVDSTAGPAVFFRLRQLRPADVVDVRRADGSTAVFRVYAVREYAKTAFPTSTVYGATAAPELRLITCGGAFDASTGHYADDVVVFARLVRSR